MNHQYGSPDPPRTLSERMHQLNESLQAMAVRLKDAIAGAVSNMIGQAIGDVIRQLLGDQEPDRFGGWHDRDDNGWYDDNDHEDPWREESSRPSHKTSSRLSDAFRTTVQTALWWLRTQPCRRPLLATSLVALTAGGAALFAGPTLAACVSIAASIASLLLTADSARTAGEMVGAAS